MYMYKDKINVNNFKNLEKCLTKIFTFDYFFSKHKKEMVKEWGPEIAEKLSRRLMELKAIDNLEDLKRLPQARFHQLKGNRDNQFSVDLKHPYRLIFEPYQEPVPLKEDGGFDLAKITAILIIEVVDYHGS